MISQVSAVKIKLKIQTLAKKGFCPTAACAQTEVFSPYFPHDFKVLFQMERQTNILSPLLGSLVVFVV